MAMVEVDTLTDDCWKECEDFEINTVVLIGDGSVYHRIHSCKNVSKCRRIQLIVEQELKGGNE